MKTFTLKTVAFALFILFAFHANAQKNTVTTHSQAPRAAVVNFAELAAYELQHPWVEPRKVILHESEGAIPENKKNDDGGAPVVYDNTPFFSGRSLLPQSPPPVHNFAGLNDNGNGIPPDVGGCAGPNHVMEVLNTQVRIFTKAGATVSTVSLGAFWNSLGNFSVFDPKVYYDPYGGRWIFITIADGAVATSKILLGVSQTNNPTGSWNLYNIDADASNANWFDFPSVGFNNKWITVMGNMFNSANAFAGSAIFSFDKASVYAGGPATYARTAGSLFTVCPAQTMSATEDTMYFVGTYSTTQMRIYRMTGPVGGEVFAVAANTAASSSWGTHSGNFAPQYGSTDLIDVGDYRMQSVVYRNGSIWCAHTAFLPAAGPNRSIVQWWQLSPSGTVIQKGRIEDPSAVMHYAYPSIAVNAAGDALLSYCRFSPNEYPCAEYALRLNGDALNTMRDGYRFKIGETWYFKDFSSGRNRWGDYTSASVDPVNDTTFWAISEYSKSPSSTWATWIAEVHPKRTQWVDFTADTTIVCNGTPLQFTDLTNYAVTSWAWTFAGGTPATSNIQNPSVTFSAAGVHNVMLIVNGTDTMIHNNYVLSLALPATTISLSPAGHTTFCQGDSVRLTASVTGTGGYLWFPTGEITRTITVHNSGTYYCVLTNAAGCTATSVSVTVTVNPLPVVTLNAFPPSVCDTITNYALTGGNPAGGTYSGTQVSGNVFHPSAAGDGTYNITYTYTDGNGCTNSAPQPLTVGTNCFVGIAEAATPGSLSVVPNPAHNTMQVNYTPKAAAEISVSITNAIGQEVFSKNAGRLAQFNESIDVSKLPAGIYFLKVKAGEESSIIKVIVE